MLNLIVLILKKTILMLKNIFPLVFISSFLIASCCEMGEEGCMVDREDCNEDLEMFSDFQDRVSSLDLVERMKTSFGSEVLSSSTLALENYFFEFDIIYQTFAFNQPNGEGDFIEINEPAYCINESLGIVESIQNIEIISKFDFNDEIKAGDSINEFFILNDEISLTEYLAKDISDRKLNFTYSYALTEKPTANELFAFAITITIDTGNSFIHESSELKFE